MGRAKRRAQQKRAAAEEAAEPVEEVQLPTKEEYTQPRDPPRAVLAVHPTGAAIAVAIGPELRVYDARCGLQGCPPHVGAKRRAMRAHAC